MVTVGGAISGYWAMGSTCEATRPASVKMIEMTDAKIGRSMKNFENTSGARLLHRRRARGGLGVGRLRAHRHAGPELQQVVQGGPLARLEPREHQPVLAAPLAGLDLADRRLVLSVEDEQEVPLLVLEHRRLRHEEGVAVFAGRDAHAYELPRQQA